MVKHEVFARVSEGSHSGSPDNIDPHHVTTALAELARSGRIIRDYSVSRGGATIPTFTPADQHRRTTKIEKAAARKRLLAARYNGWGHPNTRYPRGIIGPVVTIPIEVKSIRSWIYPSSVELYQVLDKAAALQRAHPTRPILPVLVCRKAHPTAFWMGSQLGLMVIDTGIQYLGDSVDEQDMLDVRNELYLNYLHLGTGPGRRVRDRFATVVPNNAVRLADLWRETCNDPRPRSSF